MPSASDRPSAVALLCEEPFRLLFPLGMALSAFGVSHWLLHAAGLWLVGSLWWMVVFVPKQSPRHVSADD